MCGFVVLSSSYAKGIDHNDFRKVMHHRGPDDFQVKDLGFCQMYFWRLSIQDLDHGGQPVESHCGRYSSVMNGEIYNFKSLREDLVSKGVELKSKGDAEVIPNLYAIYGENFIHKLEGMFSIVIIDHQTKEVRAYRDRSGVKPLYYYSEREDFIFSSELRAFRVLSIKGNEKQFRSMDYGQAKVFGYFPFKQTTLKDIYKLTPATSLKINQAEVTQETYWRNSSSQKTSMDDVEKTIQKVVHEYLVSDVPVGVFLSGGLDSGLIAKFASEKMSNLSALTIDFKDGNGIDAKVAKSIAKHLGLKHEVIDVSVEDIVGDLPQMIWYLDDLNTDSGLLPTFHISKVARERGLKVVLSGTGGDEVFGGYNYYRPNHWEVRLSSLSSLGNLLPDDYHKNSALSKLARSLKFKSDPAFNYLHHKMLFGSEITLGHDFYKKELQKLVSDVDHKNLSLLRMEMDYRGYLPEELLAMMDRMTMGNSIEGRVPFCDHRVLEVARNNPESITIPKGKSKPVLRHFAAKYLPDDVLKAPKMGFNSPVENWIEKNASKIYKFSLSRKSLFSGHELSGFDSFNHYQKWAVLVMGLYDLIFSTDQYFNSKPDFHLDEVLS
jgi:asparagine synthase (glutamine-hydrolysing)